jgi:hypothetical protein
MLQSKDQGGSDVHKTAGRLAEEDARVAAEILAQDF